MNGGSCWLPGLAQIKLDWFEQWPMVEKAVEQKDALSTKKQHLFVIY
jgi:hypothetical protein